MRKIVLFLACVLAAHADAKPILWTLDETLPAGIILSEGRILSSKSNIVGSFIFDSETGTYLEGPAKLRRKGVLDYGIPGKPQYPGAKAVETLVFLEGASGSPASRLVARFAVGKANNPQAGPFDNFQFAFDFDEPLTDEVGKTVGFSLFRINCRGAAQSKCKQHSTFLVSQGSVTSSAVPEPGTLALLGAGLFALGMLRLRRKGAMTLGNS